MLKIPINSIIQRIHEETGLSVDEISQQIKAKVAALEGLVSEEGAAFIIASELGVQLLQQATPNQVLQIKDLLPGMRADVSGVVERTFKVIPYVYAGKAKEMGSFILRDDTGEIRVVLWDDKAQLLKDGKIRGAVKIKGCQVKQNKMGAKELHVGAKCVVLATGSSSGESVAINECKISELKVGQQTAVLAEIVKIFPLKMYPVCSKCGKKVIPAPEGFLCSEHKQVTPENRLLLSFYLDDGSGTIRATAFGRDAEKLCSATNSQINLSQEFQDLLQTSLLGRTISAGGRVKENKNFDRTEIIIADVNITPDPKAIATKMLEMQHA